MKIIYAGTPEFAVPALQALLESSHEIVAVYTQPDRPAGRGRQLQASPVKQLALAHGLKVMQPDSFKKPQDISSLRSFEADLMVVAAYGLLLPPGILDAPRLGCINIHASLLPRWRGAAPIQRAILAGDERTGVTLMQMDAGLDTGAMLATASIEISNDMSAAVLHDKLMVMGAELLADQLAGIESGSLKSVPQDETMATYAPKLSKQEARVDWSKSAQQLQREIRAFNPWPVSHTSLGDKLVKLWLARAEQGGNGQAVPGSILNHDKSGVFVQCGDGALRIEELQFAGKKRIHAADLLNSMSLAGGFFGA